jgi:hypothetical protein
VFFLSNCWDPSSEFRKKDSVNTIHQAEDVASASHTRRFQLHIVTTQRPEEIVNRGPKGKDHCCVMQKPESSKQSYASVQAYFEAEEATLRIPSPVFGW